jgi:hypothetical protein
LLYRERGLSAWQQAATINVSRSGVLFLAHGPLPSHVRAVDFVVSLPLNGFSQVPSVRCVGRVVRIAPADAAAGGRAVAVSIDGWALEGRTAASR